MKFQTALLFAAAASFAFAQVSDAEDETKATSLDNAVESENEAANNTPADVANTPADAEKESTTPSEASNSTTPEETGNSNTPAEQTTDAAENSDDYGEKANATDAAEDSDDYGNSVDSLDASQAAEESDDDDDSTTATTAAAAAAGAAAAAAGIFVWVKKSKQNEVEKVDTLRSQFNMA